MTENLKNEYTNYLQEKTTKMSGELEKLGWENLCTSIYPSPVEGGFRNRAKFKIYHKNDTIRIMGTDPIQGEVSAEKSLWIIPEWGRICVREIYEIISNI